MNTEHKDIEPVGFEAREIGEGDWFKVGLDETERINYYIKSAQMDYRWLYQQSAIDALQAEKAALEKQRDELLATLIKEHKMYSGKSSVGIGCKVCDLIANAKGAAA